MYHSVSHLVEDSKHPYYRTATSPGAFDEQIKVLRENGFTSLSIGEAVEYSESGSTGGLKPVVITFDDGYRDFLTNAFPVLDRYGYRATVFLPTAFIGDSTMRFKGIECLTWNEVRDLRSAGVQFGSHTVTHPQLKNLGWAEVEFEVRSSKSRIEDRLGCEVTSFAYPYAFPETDRIFRRQLRRTLEEAGYKNSVSTIIGAAADLNDRFFMKRLPMNSLDHRKFFNAKLSGAYDWLRTLQFVAKLRHSTWAL